MKIFVCEFVTGGGLYREELPPHLVAEASLMLDALVTDLLDIEGVSVVMTRDVRLPELMLPVEQLRIFPQQEVWTCWEACIHSTDAVWVIAPESGGVLEQLGTLVTRCGKLLLSSLPMAIAVAASKRSTVERLQHCGIPAVPTWPLLQWRQCDAPWVVKPDDGVGCLDICSFTDGADLQVWLDTVPQPNHYVVQPDMAGIAASLSVVCNADQVYLLSVNRQIVTREHGGFCYRGSVVNGLLGNNACFQQLAERVAHAIPGLQGYFGIDFVMQDQPVVLEVNPRLTTSYAGLRQAMGANPAKLVLDLLRPESCDVAQFWSFHRVEVRVP